MSSVKDQQPRQGDTAAESQAQQLPAPSVLRRAYDQLFTSTSPIWIFLALVVIVAVFGILKPHQFLSGFDIKTIFINASVALMLSVGMTYVIITAGIDLSVGSVLVISGVLAAKTMIAVGGGAGHAETAGWGAILVGVAIGCWWGSVGGR